MGLTGMGALELGELEGVDEAAAAVDRKKAVLGHKEGMVLAQALPLAFDIGLIRGDVFGDLLPIVLKVAADAVAAFLFEIGLLHLFEEGILVPGGPIEDSGDIGSGAHGAKFFGEFVLTDILGLIHFEKKVSGIAHNVGGILCGEEDGPAVHQANDVTHLRGPIRAEPGIIELFFEPHHGDDGLGFEGRRAFDEVFVAGHIGEEKGEFELRGKLVLAALSGDFEGKGKALVVDDAIQDGPAGFLLVGSEDGSREIDEGEGKHEAPRERVLNFEL
jgi:hypothetical protein